MIDYTKLWACNGCGEMVTIKQHHTFEDCKKYLNKLRLEREGK